MVLIQPHLDMGMSLKQAQLMIEKATGVSYKTVERMLNPNAPTGPSLESIDLVAGFFRLQAWQLLRQPSHKPPLLAGYERQAQEGSVRTPGKTKKVRKRTL